MPTLKKSDSATTVLFDNDQFIDKLFARNVAVDESSPSGTVLTVEFKHYSIKQRENLEDSDFTVLQSNRSKISKLTLRDASVAKEIEKYQNISSVIIDIDGMPVTTISVKVQTADHREVVLEF